MIENLTPVLLLLAFIGLLVRALARTHRRVIRAGHPRAPWSHVGPDAPRYGERL